MPDEQCYDNSICSSRRYSVLFFLWTINTTDSVRARQKKLRERAFDESWKLVLEKYFWECLDFYFPEISVQIDKKRGYAFLDQELQKTTNNLSDLVLP